MTVYLSFRLLTGPTSQAQGKKGPGAKVESLLVVHLPSTLAQHPPNPHPTLVQVFLPSYLFCFPSMDVYPTVTPLTVTGSKTTSAGEVSVYVDLAYVPSGASSSTVNVDFFKCVRSSCYIISGDSPEREELMRQTLDALFEGKMTWSDNMQVKNTSEVGNSPLHVR